jgi:hypothetical protein
VDVTTADASIAAADIYYFELPIEAQNCSHLKYGESGAESLAISFWVRSTTTGDYQFMIQQLDTTRQYSTTYNIASADTWEQKTIIIAGDTSGVINNDTGPGLTMTFCLTGGSTFQGGTEDAWASNNNNMYAAGMTLNLFSSTSNDWYIAGLQIEIGTAATDFEFEPHSVTLNRCHRYFSYDDWTTIGDGQRIFWGGFSQESNNGYYNVQYDVEMRAAPTWTFTEGGTFDIVTTGATQNVSAMAAVNIGPRQAHVRAQQTGAFVGGEACGLSRDGTDTTFWYRSAEF